MPQLNGFLDDVRGALRQRKLAVATGVDVIASPDTGEVDAVFRNGRTRLRWLGRYPIATVGGLQYRLRPGHFFQPNRFLLEPLMSTVAEESGAGALALDLFCGSGFFSLPLARRHRRVVGVERRSVANAEWNARRNRFQNVDFVKAPAWAYLKTARIRPDALVLNPPRAGAGRAVIQGIAGLGPRRIVYVSCNPTTLAPEARRLLDSGYRLTRLRFVDQFPNTHHIETIALFEAA